MPLSCDVMLTYRVIPSLCHISMSLSCDVMPTHRVILSLCYISMLLFYDVMPTCKVMSFLFRIFMPLLYDVMPTCRVMLSGVLHSWGHSIVHFSGLYRLARALATGEATVILQAFQHNSFASEASEVLHPNPPANK